MMFTRIVGALALALSASAAVADTVTLPQIRNAGGSYVPAQGEVMIGADGVEKGVPANPVITSSILQAAPTSHGGTFGTSAAQLMPANLARSRWQMQVQGPGDCYFNDQGGTAAVRDGISGWVRAGGSYESTLYVSTAAVSIICTQAGTVVMAKDF